MNLVRKRKWEEWLVGEGKEREEEGKGWDGEG